MKLSNYKLKTETTFNEDDCYNNIVNKTSNNDDLNSWRNQPN